ncbi:hypothetical protein SELR_18350 [Selenomonas ruminantium subsp. lactilytica TAM6421]|uniref:Uncharacterized protein n=1 Tax=Selenomonas ruminantium subsp. lactilytica (strain NBRC 103574 / TAM6421) TaxID=927704 RepID=I0GS06_SELRL|nr:hypothetical protein [Selenomonas ruminantium]BAL83543.1 hypothetical protein SELR_18350 [Selenomonas ruminantium subsp. lactilytica TAM6421]
MQNESTQLVCPHCHYEFQYNDGKIGADIRKCHEKLNYLMERREIVRGNFKYAKEFKRLGVEISRVTKQLSRLKDYRRLAGEHKEKQEFLAFKEAVKEFWGEDGYKRCIKYVCEETKGYTIADIAKGTYTKAGRNGAVIN